jgi:hypothetical protein
MAGGSDAPTAEDEEEEGDDRQDDEFDFVYGTIALCGARFHVLRLSNNLVTRAERHTSRADALQPRTGNACALTPARFAAKDLSLRIVKLQYTSYTSGFFHPLMRC